MVFIRSHNFKRFEAILSSYIQLEKRTEKMEDLLNLNSSATKAVAKSKRFDDLKIGEYLVKTFKLKEFPFGLRLLVEIDNFYLILPPRFSDKINSEQQLAEINAKKFKMVYGGKDPGEFNKLIIDFVLLSDRGGIQSNEDDSTVEDSEEIVPTTQI